MANNIIVKVGKTSELAFSKSKVYRAITVDELELICNKHNECHVVVIESIREDEQETAKSFISGYLAADSQNKVLFYIPNNDDITSGVADELDANIYLKQKDLYGVINKILNTNVSIFLDDKKQESVNIGGDDDFTDLFGDALESGEENINTDELDKAIETQEAHNKEVEDKKAEIRAEKLAKIEKDKEETAEAEAKKAEETSSEPEVKVVTKTVEVSSAKDTETILNLQQRLSDIKYEYELAVDDMKQANKRIDSLEKLVKAANSERDDIKKRYNELTTIDNVIEDPISLSEYQLTKDELVDKDAKIKELQSNIDRLNKDVVGLNNTISSKDTNIEELQAKIEVLTGNIDKLNEAIKSGEIHKDALADAERKYKKLELEYKDLEIDLRSKEVEIASREDDIVLLKDKLTEADSKLRFEAQVRMEQTRVTQSAFLKLKEISDKSNSLDSEKEGLQNTISNLQQQLNDALVEVNKKNEEVLKAEAKVTLAEQQMSLQDSQKNSENTKYTSKISELETQLDVVKEQLKTKTAQYDLIVQTSGIDENSAGSLAETNKVLKNANKTLKEQLSTVQDQMGMFKKANEKLSSQNTQLETQVKQLRDMAQRASENGGGTIGGDPAELIAPIDYRGKAQLITVSGSGSFGITTTAMSLAYKLMITSNVLYFDFDLITPKADAWFNRPPMCKVDGLAISGIKATGLGVFYELGLPMFKAYASKIITTIEKSKGGQLDYLSGLYYRPDPLKIASADLSGLLNFISTKYDYIIFDRGILGASSIVDRIQKVLSDVSYRNIVVTTKDNIELRNFRNLLNTIGINVNNVQWLLNMAQDTRFDEKLRKHIMPAKFSSTVFNPEMFGTREKFSKDRLNRDKFESFLNNVVFKD